MYGFIKTTEAMMCESISTRAVKDEVAIATFQ